MPIRQAHPLCLILACAMLSPLEAAAQPTDAWVVWASDREDGRHEIYRMKADGSGVTRLTQNGGKFATWSPDGSWVSYHRKDVDEAYVIRPDGSEEKKLGAGLPRFWLYDGSGLAVQEGFDVYLYDAESGNRVQKLWSKSEFSRIADSSYELFEVMGLTPNKRWLVVATDYYEYGATGDNGTFQHGWAPQLLDLQNKDKLYFFGAGCEGTTSPISNDVYHVNGEDKPNYRFHTMDTADVTTRSSYQLFYDYPEADWGHEYFPRLSTDGKWLVYGSTTGCHDHDTCDYEIWLHEMGDGEERTRLTNHSGNDQWPHLYVGSLWDPSMPGPDPITGPVHLKINSGGGNDVSGWTSDAPYRSDGEAYTFRDATVDLNGQKDPAPEQVYTTCIHLDHSYSFPVPDGRYLVRLHFFDGVGDERAMDYTIEGEMLLDDFNITAASGGPNRALVQEFEVQVQDGDGLQIVATKDQGNDAFESGIEILSIDPASPADGAVPAADDGGTSPTPTPDGGALPAGDGGAPSAGLDDGLVSGCALTSGGGDRSAALMLLSLLLLLLRRRPQKHR